MQMLFNEVWDLSKSARYFSCLCQCPPLNWFIIGALQGSSAEDGLFLAIPCRLCVCLTYTAVARCGRYVAIGCIAQIHPSAGAGSFAVYPGLQLCSLLSEGFI